MDVEVTVKKLRKPAIVYIIAPSGNSELEGRKIVDMWKVLPSVSDKNAFAGIFTVWVLSEYFPSSYDRTYLQKCQNVCDISLVST